MSDDGALHGQGISFPPRLGSDGRIAWSRGADNVRESITVLLQTDPGERLMLPGFGGGLRSFLFETNSTPTHRLVQERVTFALTRWEPRIRLESVEVDPDPDAPDAALVSVRYRLVATGETGGVSVTVPVGA